MLGDLFRKRLLLGQLLCFAVLSGEATAASISGTVRSEDGIRLPGAMVVVRGPDDEFGPVISGERGVFQVSHLPKGSYEILVELPGFQPRSFPGIELSSKQTVTLDLVLALTLAGEEMITVIGNSPSDSLEAAAIRESSAHDVGEALATTPGIWKIRKGGIANDLFLRGFQGRTLNVLIDGTRVFGACPNNMDPSSFHVDFAEVDRIEVGKGPFDMRNHGGLGGTVNIVTKRPRAGWGIQPTLAMGSFGFFNPSVSGFYGKDSFSFLGGFSYRRSGVYRDGSGEKFTELTNFLPDAGNEDAFRVGTAWGKLSWSPYSNHRLQVAYARQEASHVFYPYLKMDAVYDDTDRFSLRYEVEDFAGPATRLSILTFYSEVAHWMTDEYRSSSSMGVRDYSMGSMAQTRTLGGTVQVEMNHLSAGAEFTRRFWGVTTEMAGMNYRPQFSLPDVSVNTVGLFVEYSKPLAERLSLTTGGRLDWSDSLADGNKANTELYYAYHGTRSTMAEDLLPGLMGHLSYEPTSMIELGVGLGSAMMVPEPSDRYFALKRMGADWVGNPALKPPRNTSVDASIAFDHSRVFFGGNLFFSWVDNFVTLYDQPRLNLGLGVMNSQARSYQNVDARLWGAEASAVIPLTDALHFTGDFSYVRGIQDSVSTEDHLAENMAEIPPFRSHIALRFDNGRFFGSVESLFSALQTRVNLELNEEETAGFVTFGLRGGIRRGPVSLTAGVENLLNRNYLEHLSYQRDPFRSGVRVTEPGRSFFTSLILHFED